MFEDIHELESSVGFPCGSYQCRRHGFDPWIENIPWRREWQPTQIFLPGKSCGRRSLVGYSLWGHKDLDMTE